MVAEELAAIGLGGAIALSRVIAVGRWASAPIRRAARKAKAEGRLIDLTYGKACRWVYFMDSGHVVLGATKKDMLFKDSSGEVESERDS